MTTDQAKEAAKAAALSAIEQMFAGEVLSQPDPQPAEAPKPTKAPAKAKASKKVAAKTSSAPIATAKAPEPAPKAKPKPTKLSGIDHFTSGVYRLIESGALQRQPDLSKGGRPVYLMTDKALFGGEDWQGHYPSGKLAVYGPTLISMMDKKVAG